MLVNWTKEHDLGTLSKAMGRLLTGYMEFKEEETERRKFPYCYCSKCGKETEPLYPTKETKEHFRQGMKEIDAPATLSPAFRHFWYHARCAECGADVLLLRS